MDFKTVVVVKTSCITHSISQLALKSLSIKESQELKYKLVCMEYIVVSCQLT